jgi:hypothetical protein
MKSPEISGPVGGGVVFIKLNRVASVFMTLPGVSPVF